MTASLFFLLLANVWLASTQPESFRVAMACLALAVACFFLHI